MLFHLTPETPFTRGIKILMTIAATWSLFHSVVDFNTSTVLDTICTTIIIYRNLVQKLIAAVLLAAHFFEVSNRKEAVLESKGQPIVVQK
jgi:hypothetical protein